jgi:hypothetical protein
MMFNKRQFLHLNIAAGATLMTDVSAAPAQNKNATPPMVGVRFSAAGEALPMRGNTIVCPLPPASPVTQEMLALHRALRHSIAAHCMALLPPASLHMTLINGALDTERTRANWPANLPTDSPLTDCDRLFTTQMKSFDMGCNFPFRMIVSDTQSGFDDPNALLLYLEPADAAQARKIRDLRDRIADVWQLRHPGHDIFRFHTTQAYITAWPSPAELAAAQNLIMPVFDRMRRNRTVLELPDAAFCFFDDMLEFRPRVQLRRL